MYVHSSALKVVFLPYKDREWHLKEVNHQLTMEHWLQHTKTEAEVVQPVMSCILRDCNHGVA